MHQEAHPLAGKAVDVGPGDHHDIQEAILEGARYVVEDWADRVIGMDPWRARSNFAMLHYADRSRAMGLGVDNELLYGKIGSFGHVLHTSELGEEV